MSNPMIPAYYQTHVENVGWTKTAKDGELSGTVGQSLRIEAIKIWFENRPGLGVRYQVHVENIGWQGWVSDGAVAGTEGESKRLEAIQIELTGADADLYSVWYRTYSENIGWSDWKRDGQISGTTGEALRAESIEIVITYKSADIIVAETDDPTMSVMYSPQVENVGWQSYVKNGISSCMTGRELRLEAIKIKIEDAGSFNLGVRYRTHIQNIGWQDWVENDEISGTIGEGLRLEAIEAFLTGDDANLFSICYSVYVTGIGWTDFVKDGETCGTTGEALMAESIRILVIKASEDLNRPVSNVVANNMPYIEITGFEYPDNEFLLHSPRVGVKVLNPILTDELNKVSSLTFSLSPDHAFYDGLKKMLTYIRVYETAANKVKAMIFEGRILKDDLGFEKIKKVTCEGSLGFLLDSIQQPETSYNITVEQWVAKVLDKHNVDMGSEKRFHVGTVIGGF